jgi:hypothetical protein
VRDVRGSATVRDVWDSATVRDVGGSATVRDVGGSATVRDVGHSATVRDVRGSATVRDVWGTASLRLYDHSTASDIGPHVTVIVHTPTVTVTGGHIIDLSTLDDGDPRTWAEVTGAKITGRDGHETVHLFKAVDEHLNAGHSYRLTAYPIGQDVTAPDWVPTRQCGHGLHASPRPRLALGYYPDAARMLEVTVPLADLIPLGDDKAKARTVHVVREVTLTGDPLPEAVTK